MFSFYIEGVTMKLKIKKSTIIALTAVTAYSATMLHSCSQVSNFDKNEWDNTNTLTVEAKQGKRVSLDSKRLIKDQFNKSIFKLPTTAQTAQNINIGTAVIDEMRWGSFILEAGSNSNAQLIVQNKTTQNFNDEASKTIELTLRERHFSFNPLKHMKDWLNESSFDWDVSNEVYNQIKDGHNFISFSEGYRAGSQVTKGSSGFWVLEVTDKYPKQNKKPIQKAEKKALAPTN